MKKMLLVVGLLIGVQARASVSCMDGEGYYGNIQLNDTGRMIRVTAEQGFAVEISTQLGVQKGREISKFTILFFRAQCNEDVNNIRCAGSARVIAEDFGGKQSNLIANLDLKMSLKGKTGAAQLSIQVPSTGKIGVASHDFRPPLGTCLR